MSSSPQPILFIASRGTAGAGGENYLLSIIQHMDRTAFTPIAVLPREGNLRLPLEQLGVEVHLLEPHADYSWLKHPNPWYRLLGGMQERCQALVKLIEDRGISLVHTNSNIFFEGAMAAQLAGVPHIYLAHIERQLDMPIYRRVRFDQGSFAQIMGILSCRIIAVSESVAATLAPYTDPGKVRVIHNGIEPERFCTALENPGSPLRSELGLEPQTPLVTAVGRVCYDKGFDFFAEAAARVVARDDKAHFLVVGDTANKSFFCQLRETIAEIAPLNGRFHFLGFRKDVPEILAQSDIFVLSSRREGHPYVLLESMAARCAPVASLCAGVAETIRNGETGFSHPVGDVSEMADQIVRLLEDTALRERFSQSAQDDVFSRFTAARSAENLFQEYVSCLSPTEDRRPGNAGVALFLQACAELSLLGTELEAVKDQLREIEQSTRFIRENRFRRALRSLRRSIRGDKK